MIMLWTALRPCCSWDEALHLDTLIQAIWMRPYSSVFLCAGRLSLEHFLPH